MSQESAVARSSVAESRPPFWLVMTAAVCMGVGLGGLALAMTYVFRPPVLKEDIAAGAERVLLRMNGAPLSQPLEQILRESPKYAERSHDHPLVGKPAPNFELMDTADRKRTLREFVGKGPVVLVFYYGYYCDHCVAQLFGLNKDLAYFRELGAEVVAVSPDKTAETREKFAEYAKSGGKFDFPVLSDPDNAAAAKFECYTPANHGRPELQLHGTFLVDKEGVVRWANMGLSPFANNRSLLADLARMQGRFPAEEKRKD